MLLGLLRLKCGEIAIEPTHILFPEPAIVLYPIRNLPKRSSFQTAGTPLRVAAAPDETGAFENLEMFGDGWRADGKRLGEIFDRRFA
jgi:hypothetical protein